MSRIKILFQLNQIILGQCFKVIFQALLRVHEGFIGGGKIMDDLSPKKPEIRQIN